MEERGEALVTPKEYLSRYRDLGRSIDAKRAQIQRLREQAAQITQAINPDRVHGSGEPDKLSSAVCQIMEAVEDIEEQVQQREAVRREIESTIAKVEDSTQRALLEYRYLSDYSFERIAVALHYSYKQVCRLHGKALHILEDVLECPIGSVL